MYRRSAGVLGLCALFSSVSGFSTSGAACGRGLSSIRPARSDVCTGGTNLRMVTTGSAMPLDPMQLVQDKAMQTCALRPHKSKTENGGLSTATFALG